MPEDHLLDAEAALAARELIASPAYALAIRTLELHHTNAMVTSLEGPEGAPNRERHHRMLCALHELHSEIVMRALADGETEVSPAADAADDIEDEI